jgi:hypothetical protein
MLAEAVEAGVPLLAVAVAVVVVDHLAVGQPVVAADDRPELAAVAEVVDPDRPQLGAAGGCRPSPALYLQERR